MELNRQKVLDVLAQNREALKRLGVRSLALFGSVARDEAVAGSDLDFVVELSPKSFDSYMDVKLFLEDLFACKVDLVLPDSIKPRLRGAILKELVHAPGL